MSNVCIITDSNSGISQEEALTLGIKVIPMPFFIDGVQYYEGINLTQEQFYDKLKNDADISTSQPSVGELQNAFAEVLKTHDEAVFIPMSSGLSGTCQTASMLAEDYHGKVNVVNNQRISVTQRQSVLDAILIAKKGKFNDYIPFGPFIVASTLITIFTPSALLLTIVLKIFTLGMYQG